MTFLDAVVLGLEMVVVWPAIGYLCLGVVLGMFFDSSGLACTASLIILVAVGPS